MKARTSRFIITVISMFLTVMMVQMPAQSEGDAAQSILKTMTDYISGQESIKLKFDSDIEIITPQLEKIQFASSGTAILTRPNKLYAHRVSGHADVTLFYDGKTASIYEKQANGYVQLDAPGSLDQLIEVLRVGEGIALPGADLLLSNAYDVLLADTMEGKYIGRGIIGGRRCDHLAFRNFDTDWQLWVQAEGDPIPCKMVITSKTMNSAPQYTLRINSWDATVKPEQAFFAFTPPAGAKKLDREELIKFDELPHNQTEGDKP